MIIGSFVFFLIAFVLIGVASTRFHDNTTEDYLLASQNIKPWLVGFSFFATENSGFMFVGFVGMAYSQGLSAIWLLIGWYVGEVMVLWWTGRQIREQTSAIKADTYSNLLSRWTGEEYVVVRRLSALIVMVFLGVYGAAQLSAGSKALHVLMNWEYNTGAFIGFVIVVLYCAAGGIRASIWTDAAQAIVMFASLIVLTAAGLANVGGVGVLFDKLEAVDPRLVALYPAELKFGFLPFFLGWLFAGIGVLGQAHVMVRFMVIDHARNVRRALLYYLGMVSVLAVLCLTVGLLCRIALPELAAGDAELGLPMLSAQLLPDVLIGLVLAGLFSAAISTADSQILSSSAALSRDLLPQFGEGYLWTKVGTVIVACIALAIAVSGYNDVFALVTFAWAVMAAGFMPLLFLLVIGAKPNESQSLMVMLIGIAASLAWHYAGLAEHVYNVLPGILAGFLTYAVVRGGASRKEEPHAPALKAANS
ncbi:MAG: sodium/proline symporter [Bdellovibrionales bacterium]|nr:sodium/proline symporter [Bdellovibrionales bacterium]